MKRDYTLSVTFENLHPSQVLTLQAMFSQWETLGKFGASRSVSFFVDGDGPFHPEIEMESNLEVELTDELADSAEFEPYTYDFDAIWRKSERLVEGDDA